MAISLKKFRFTKLNDLLLVTFITSIGVALLNPIWSLYFYDLFKNPSLVGVFSSLLSLVALVCFFIFTPIIQKFQEKKIYNLSLLFSIIILLLIALTKNIYVSIFFIIVYVMLMVLRGECFGILFREESQNKSIGKNEGLAYTLSNLGWLMGALFVIPLLNYYKFSTMFLFSAIFTLVALLIFSFYKRTIKKSNDEISLFKTIKEFFKNKILVKGYIASTGMSVWSGFIFVYVPIYIIRNNMDRSYVGIFLFAFVLPYLIEYFIGKKSDLVGNKFFITLGYLIISVCSLIAFFVNNFKISLAFLILSSFGISFISPTRESYFFKSTNKKEEEKYYGVYLTHIEIGLLMGKIIPAVLLLYFSFNYMFLFFAVIMFLFYLYSLKLKDV